MLIRRKNIIVEDPPFIVGLQLMMTAFQDDILTTKLVSGDRYLRAVAMLRPYNFVSNDTATPAALTAAHQEFGRVALHVRVAITGYRALLKQEAQVHPNSQRATQLEERIAYLEELFSDLEYLHETFGAHHLLVQEHFTLYGEATPIWNGDGFWARTVTAALSEARDACFYEEGPEALKAYLSTVNAYIEDGTCAYIRKQNRMPRPAELEKRELAIEQERVLAARLEALALMEEAAAS